MQYNGLKITFEELDQMDDAKLEELFIKTQLQDLSPKLKTIYFV